MLLPLWVPWLLVLSLALPVLLATFVRARPSRGAIVAMLVPAIVAALLAAQWTLDRAQVSQEELDTAVTDAARDLGGSLGPVNTHDVAGLVEADLGHETRLERSGLTVASAVEATYTIQVRVGAGDDAPTACLEVTLEVLDGDAPDLKLATLTPSSGPC